MIRRNLPALLLLIVFNLFHSKKVVAQHKAESESEKGAHKLSLHFAEICYPKHGDVFRGTALPAYSINYDYVLNSHWSIGSHNDVLLEDMKEEGAVAGAQSFSRPVTAKLIGAYHYSKHLGCNFGLGDEVSNHENVLLTSLGADYVIHLRSNWEVGAEVSYDMKFDHTDNWVLGFGITRIIGRHHKG